MTKMKVTMNPSFISVIIPTLNEQDNIATTLNYLRSLNSKLELIVVDAGSSDLTCEHAEKLSTVIHSKTGRGAQMNAGARKASGEILWFIHADCQPHADSVQAINQCMTNEKIVGGGFEYNLDHPGRHFRIVEFFSNFKNRKLQLLFGDMGIFVRREVFERMGGYSEIPLMEDMDFNKRLQRYGKIKILPQRINTSARRWIEDGYIVTSIRSWILQTAWALGASPTTLARFYKFK